MHFQPKIDSFFIIVLSVIIVVISAVFLVPLGLDLSSGRTFSTGEWTIILSIYLASVGFMLWTFFGIKYALHDDHLYVQGGPFRSHIRYSDITKVASSLDMYTGYKLLTAKKGIEIHYRTAFFGCVKISPKEIDLFLVELKKRCPNAIFQIDQKTF